VSGVAARTRRRGERARRADGTLDRRLAALAEAAELARGRLDDAAVDAARAVVDRAGRRLGLGVEATVIAFAGPTGAGKSTLFNALSGRELAAPGHRRPTTSVATAAVWGDVPDALLDWLEVPRRHRMAAGGLDGLVLLDLPDFDSVVLEHRVEVDRVIGLADLIVWVADPQKYADAALHERYLRRFAAYGDSMLVVLNQADRLARDDLDACLADLAALLDRDGLPHVPVLALSARTGEGIEPLRAALAERVALREAASTRLAADVTTAAAGLAPGCGEGAHGSVGRADRAALIGALEEAAAVPAVVGAVKRAHRRRGALATGWPFARWALRLRPDPLRRLRLPDVVEADRPADRASLPAPTPVQQAQVASGARAVAVRAAGGLPDPWPGLLRAAAVAAEEEIPGRLEAAVAGTDLGLRAPRWWRLAGAAQRVLAVVALAGVLWLAALAVLGYLRLDDVVPTPELEGIAVPTLLLAAGGGGGLLLALLARLANAAGAGRRARAAAAALRARVAAVAEDLVLAPVERELDARQRLCAAVAAATET
jgi:GTP-binding protein EngB required for normal cell division